MENANTNDRNIIIEINNRTEHKIDLNLIKRVTAEFARVYKLKHKEVSIAFVSDAEIKKINQAYRKLNKPTDVLSFTPSNSAEGNLTGQAGEGDFFGEIIIDYSQIKRQAGKFNHSAQEELVFILVHGLLHLLGYNDQTVKTKKEMIKIGEEFIKNFEI
ncbi:MAG: rRNA maturation RNase YbeY [bacterium]|nr:rRNA maturation RNase YbeY [bacterium]